MAKKSKRKVKYKTRQQRLASAKEVFLKGLDPKVNVVRAYRKFFRVDIMCSIRELRMLGVEITEEYEKQILSSIERNNKRKQKRDSEDDWNFEQDENFYFIAGYTSGGAPYGTTWEEAHEEGLCDDIEQKNEIDL